MHDRINLEGFDVVEDADGGNLVLVNPQTGVRVLPRNRKERRAFEAYLAEVEREATRGAES